MGGVENLFYDIYGVVATRNDEYFIFRFVLGIEMGNSGSDRSGEEAAINAGQGSRGQVKFSRSIDHGVASGPPLNWLSKPNCGSSAAQHPSHDKLINGEWFSQHRFAPILGRDARDGSSILSIFYRRGHRSRYHVRIRVDTRNNWKTVGAKFIKLFVSFAGTWVKHITIHLCLFENL